MSLRIEPQNPSEAPVGPARSVVRGGLIGAAIAVTGCLVVYAIGNAGAPIRVVTGWSPDGAELTVAEVIATVVVSIALGTGLLALLQRRRPNAWSTWRIVVALVAIASAVPLFGLDVDAGSKVALASMHLTTGVASIAGQTIARHRRLSTSTSPAPAH